MLKKYIVYVFRKVLIFTTALIVGTSILLYYLRTISEILIK